MLLTLLAVATFYAVDPISNTRYLPDTPPKGGVKGGEVRLLAAKGEYESGSVVVSSDVALKDVTASWGDFVAGNGAKIPASAMDVKLVLCWYQQGTAWYGFHADMTRRVLTPELLVHDEKMLKVDDETGDDYVRCDHADGSTDWYWTTYLPLDCNLMGGYYAFRSEWVHDAKTLQPFDLAAGRYRQMWLTVGVPAGAKEGVYRSALVLRHAGAPICTVPIALRVLPFELPKPGTFRDPNRRFYVSMYMGPECKPGLADDMAADYARHNLTSPFLATSPDDDSAKRLYDTLERNGLDTTMLFSHLPSCFYTMSNPPRSDDADWARYCNFLQQLSNAVRRVNARFGGKAVPFAYGYDEAGAAKVRAERAAWKNVHELGGRTIVATRMRDYILFSLDAACIPEQPAPMRKAWCDTLHESNPDMLVGWYSDPHSGPENPELARRQYGWQSWRNNYDLVAQYVMFVRGWAEFNRPHENDLRSLTMCYMGDRQVIDTLQWEGFREAIDDIRYGTLLKSLAIEASHSKDVDTMYLGRAALSWLAQVPYESCALNTLRLETVDKILKLRQALGK